MAQGKPKRKVAPKTTAKSIRSPKGPGLLGVSNALRRKREDAKTKALAKRRAELKKKKK